MAAATNLHYVLPELAKEFEEQTGHQLVISYAASGTLTTQIQHGAPFELFLSANPEYIDRLIKAGLTEGKPINYAQAQLALFAANDSSLNIEDGIQSLKQALEQGKLKKIAIANPRHAPYGKIARKVLEKAEIWEKIQTHLLIAENASQAVQFSLISSVDAALVPLGHVIQPSIASLGRFVKIEARLQQQTILMLGASEAAQQFLIYIQQQQAKALFSQYGFL